MQFEEFKNYLEDKIAETRLELTLQGSFCPLFIVTAEELPEPTEAMVNLDDKDEARELMRHVCSKPEINAAAFIFDGYTMLVDKDKADDLPESIKDEKEAIETIVTFLYSRDKTLSRRILYRRNEDGRFWFGDEGWQEISDGIEGRFSNPFHPNS